MNGLEGEQKKFENYPEFHREPVKFLKNRGDVLVGGGSGDNASSRVLNQLKLMEGFLGETMQKRIAVVNTGGNKTMYKNGRRLGGKRRKQSVNVT